MITEAFVRSSEQVTNSLHHAGAVLSSVAESSNFTQNIVSLLAVAGIVSVALGVPAIIRFFYNKAAELPDRKKRKLKK